MVETPSGKVAVFDSFSMLSLRMPSASAVCITVWPPTSWFSCTKGTL